MYVVSVGNQYDGIRLYGPFDTFEKAEAYSHIARLARQRSNPTPSRDSFEIVLLDDPHEIMDGKPYEIEDGVSFDVEAFRDMIYKEWQIAEGLESVNEAEMLWMMYCHTLYKTTINYIEDVRRAYAKMP